MASGRAKAGGLSREKAQEMVEGHPTGGLPESAKKGAPMAAKTKGGKMLEAMARRHAGSDFQSRFKKLAGENPHRRVYEDEVGGSYKAGHSQRIARPSLASVNRRPTKRNAGTAREILRLASRK